MKRSSITRFLVAACVLAGALPTSRATTDPEGLAGLSGATVIDDGTFVVRDAGPFDRRESFEVLRRRAGGFTLVNTLTAANGACRAQGRFDFDPAWNAIEAHGIGLYKDRPVAISIRRGQPEGRDCRAAPRGI
jgi:hypothetical protein